jgi:hypothetical protein
MSIVEHFFSSGCDKYLIAAACRMKHDTANAHTTVNTKDVTHTKLEQHNEYTEIPFTRTLSNHSKLVTIGETVITLTALAYVNNIRRMLQNLNLQSILMLTHYYLSMPSILKLKVNYLFCLFQSIIIPGCITKRSQQHEISETSFSIIPLNTIRLHIPSRKERCDILSSKFRH